MTRRSAVPALVLVAACAGLSACAEGMQGWRFKDPPAFAAEGKPCHDTSFPIYFDRGSDQLTADARALIGAVGGQLKACRVRSAEVVGLAGGGESGETVSFELSRRRADVVARALGAVNLPVPKNDLVAEGAAGAVTPGGRREPLRRRTEVILKVTAT